MNSFSINKSSWFLIKLALLQCWLNEILQTLGGYSKIMVPVSVWKLVPFVDHISLGFILLLKVSSIVIGLLWLFERKMLIVAPLLGLISTVIFTIEESNGIYNRHMTLSAVFFAIAIAYIVKHYNPNSHLEKNRIQYPMQIIAATYMLSGISKLRVSGLSWIFSGKYTALQILKSHYSNYFSSGDFNLIAIGNSKADFVVNNPSLLIILLGLTLLIELNAWVLIAFPAYSKLYGLLLIGMHLGIYWLLDIYIASIVVPMIILIYNPLEMLVTVLKKTCNYFQIKLLGFKR